MHVPPIPEKNKECDRNGNQHSQRRGYLDGHDQREQRHCQQGFAEAEDRTDQRRGEQDENNKEDGHQHSLRHCRGRSRSKTSERSCTLSNTTSRPSGEISKSRISKPAGRLVSCRSTPVSGSISQRSLCSIPPRRKASPDAP